MRAIDKKFSVEKLKEIDSKLADLSESEIIEIRDSLYDLGQLIFDDWLENGSGSKYPVRSLPILWNDNKIKLCQLRALRQRE